MDMVSPERQKKLERFDEIMRKRFGVKWEKPSTWDWRQEGPGADPRREGPGNGKTGGGNPNDGHGPEAKSAGEAVRGPAVAQAGRLQKMARQAGAKWNVSLGTGEPETALPSPDRTAPNRAENEFMMNLMVLRNSLYQYGPVMRERCRRAGRYVWRDLRLMTRIVSTLQDALMRTMPETREAYYDEYRRNGHYELVLNGPVRQKRYVMISDRKLAAVMEAAMCSECVMCMREGSEIRKCELREAMLEVAPPTEVQDGRWIRCEYRRAAGQLVSGEDITI